MTAHRILDRTVPAAGLLGLAVDMVGLQHARNCAANLAGALCPHGISRSDFDFDCCFTTNMNLTYGPDGCTNLSEPLSTPGDCIDLKAQTDLILGISNCPQDRNSCNVFKRTPIQVRLLNEQSPI